MCFPLTKLSGGDKLQNNEFKSSKIFFKPHKKYHRHGNDEIESLMNKVDAFWEGKLDL